MNRRFGPSLLFVSLLALLLLPHAGWSTPQAAADAAYAKKIEAMLPPKVECVASSSIAILGQSVTLTARVHEASAGLVYSFSSNGGRLYPDGSMARLDTTGVAAGRTISATCQVTNESGKKGSANVTVHVVALRTVKTAGYGAIAEQAEMAAKSVHHANAGAAQEAAAQPETAHDHAVNPVAQDEEAQSAAPAQQAAGEESGGAAAPPPARVAAAPPPPRAAAPAPPAPAMAAAAPPPALPTRDPYLEAEVREQWVKELKDGRIDYKIPDQMKLHETSVVTVIVHGFADTSQNVLPGAKNGTLKVSPYMRMQLTADDNPDEFEIDPKVGAVLPVPISGSTKWTWNVVPKQPATNQKLTIEAFLVYSESGDNPQELLPSYIATVSVGVPGFWESVREEFWNNPSAAVKYVLPGGAGFTAAAALVVWWWKRRHPSENKPDKKEEEE